MAIHGLVRNTETLEYFPQPSIPDSSCVMQYDGHVEGKQEYSNEVNDHIIGALRECLEEIDIKGREFLKNIVSNKDVEIPLGKLAREAIGESRAKDLLEKIAKKVGKKMKAGKHDDFVVAERGVSIDEELNQKLERFKVKTVNIGGVVKEDKK
ncbi:hypothetical protein L2E82_28186 [Cichorium intybus]|uniref:Uncharacterized protein n=1 Tax=Cichorium intybus TaxID=13427 RepID=A0ACB9CV96_CICIN|nr:hypothetical protein L2E82_28186 [Cichorium intybus]